MRIKGNFGFGGLGYIDANLICARHNINGVVRFYIDTGSTTTTINQTDALRIGIPILLLIPSSNPTHSVSGLIYPHILPDCQILFNFIETILLERIGDVHVLPLTPPWNSISLLGLDVLKKFSIEFKQDHFVLVR
ncbi:MAG: retropepsin-like aspartic protease [Candidatus Nitrosopolaris sp.]